MTGSFPEPSTPPPLTIMARGIDERPYAAAESSKEKDALTPEDGATSKKGRGLLPVPSRSSSQKVHPSSTATAGDPRDSIDGRSKESRGSMLRPNHNGSASSNRLGAGTGPTATPGNSEPNSPGVSSHKKKKGGLLALFGCCGVPDSANGLDTDPPPAHKLEKIPARPATASRRTATPSEQPSGSKTHLSEKESSQPATFSQGAAKNGKRVSGTSTQDQSTVGGERDNESKQTTLVSPGSSNPGISVEPPHAVSTDIEKVEEVPSEKDAEGDVPMPDAGPARPLGNQGAAGTAEESLPRVPPPPPGPVPAVPNAPTNTLIESPPVFAPDQPQRFLLPPQAPEHKGRKCLVLDLDETLVHSSFKVGKLLLLAPFPVMLTVPDLAPGRLHNTGGN